MDDENFDDEEDEWISRGPSMYRRTSAPTAHSLYILPFGFDVKTSFAATESLLNVRSANFSIRQKEEDNDIWKRPPPDFRPQVYAPKPPKRNSRDAVKPWKYHARFDDEPPRSKNIPPKLPEIFAPVKPGENLTKEKPRFIRTFRINDSYDAKLDLVKKFREVKGSVEPYQQPEPHDFRNYPSLKKLGLDEFTTSYERDPFNINFQSERLNTIHGLVSAPPMGSRNVGIQMAPPMSPQEKWEARLILDKDPWPEKSAEYTRYRRRRTAHSALMDRIEDTLSKKWYREKMKVNNSFN
ncbi:DgyrCDS41 [Dimorphilus gyrociliatus]|uniref:DgyrCDS41 n=1 Tax=Dimorphilus gyrociliatus TaxID=2664684 RepID=A0A7I8V564_9ANNE|nr:DgyrCDS41 [Dimorphilus gyrociliatus]